ncbi:hypothetical protein VTN02DRAFT_3615 [Thermoascus thermophilus]
MASRVDQENMTTDISAAQSHRSHAKSSGKDKKSRSKSLGPGGLDALQDTNGNRRKSAAVFPLKSILKPTIPVSPVRTIPTFEETRRRTPARSPERGKNESNNGGNSQGQEGLLIDFSTPTRTPAGGADSQANPFDAFNASAAIRDAAREREEREKRERERQAIIEQREARRKSMANRRVSFAPEATLHTWNVVELAEDSTSSSASNSTRHSNHHPGSDASEPPSTPEQAAGPNRRSSGTPAGSYDTAGSEELSSSPYSGSSAGGSEEQSPARMEDDASSDSDNDFDGESTAMSLDDATGRSHVTTHSNDSGTSSSARLDEALRQAAREAGTRVIEDDENGDMSMEIADQEITGAFQPWIKKGQRISFDMEDMSALHDEENLNPYQLEAGHETVEQAESEDEDNDYEDLSMEMTNALGRILSKDPSRRRSVPRGDSPGAETNYEEQTMEFTNVVGGIAQQPSPAKSIGGDSNVNEDEEMTMEFTSVVGGLLNRNPTASQGQDENLYPRLPDQPNGENRNYSDWGAEEDDPDGMDMEITRAVGGILPATEERTEPQEDQTVGMDITEAVGKILPPDLEMGNKQQGGTMMDLESDAGQPASSPFQEQVQQSPRRSPQKSPTPQRVATIASESGSPSRASVKSRQTRASLGPHTLTTPSSHSRQTTPVSKPSTPSKQLTPQPMRPSTPSKTPPSSSRRFQSASPEKLLKPELQASASRSKSPYRGSIFEHNTKTGQATPTFVLRPPGRRTSGLGIDKEGLGSPRVAAMLDGRKSIGENAQEFVPQEPSRGVRFEDPLKLQEEVDREREEEENREDGHIPPAKANERDVTANLKEMISSLTPKKNKLRGRKSLHVGAAKGLLGKRPVELDQEDPDEENASPKRLRGREASPVKSVRLPAPPTKDETVGRRRSPSPGKNISTTPKEQSKFKDAISPAAQKSPSVEPATEPQADEQNPDAKNPEPEFEPIHLQDFLNMTNIHFMELNTTKRRHTTAPGSEIKPSKTAGEDGSGDGSINLEDCVAAGFCTVPMLELYQHSCRELKSYISEGRRVIRDIETETYADNPPLFREYVTAPPDIRLLMDNQFRNVKTHARLLSKAMWYEWRMKLLEGLKEGLDRHVEEMKADDVSLSKQEQLLNDVVPGLVEKHAALQAEATNLQQLADEMENCDQDELRSAREKLASIDAEIAEKKRQLAEMQEDLQDKTDTIEAGAELKEEFLQQIREAERVQEECRGWSVKEVNALKASVQDIESRTGWSILSATPSPGSPAGPSVTMRYRNELRILFHPGAFRVPHSAARSADGDTQMNMPLELTYSPSHALASASSQLTPTKSLLLKSLRKHLASIPQSSVEPRQLLRFVSEAWDLAQTVEEEIRVLGFCGVTRLKLVDDAEDGPLLRARCILLGGSAAAATTTPRKQPKEAKGRVDVDFTVKTRVGRDSTDGGELGKLELDLDVVATKVYGFGSNCGSGISESQMRDILRKEVQGKQQSSGRESRNGVWGRAVRELAGRVF